MPRTDPDAYREYMREYTRKKRREKKMLNQTNEPTQDKDDFNVVEAVIPQGTETIDLNSKQAKEILEKAKTLTKDPISDEEDPVMKYIEKGMKYLPIIMEAFKGFNMASQRYQANQPQARPSIQPPAGWESMSGLARLGKKYSDPAWYEAGERWESFKTTGAVTTTNTGYVDPTYTTPPPQDLRQLAQKHPEPPLVKDQEPQENFTETEPQRKPEFVKKAEEKREEPEQEEPKGDETTMIVNALREDNNKYIELAFNYLASLEMEKFKEYVNKPETFKSKMGLLPILLPFQTKEMIKNTKPEELVEIFKEKVPDKYEWLKEQKKLPELKALFVELQKMM